ncbi:ANFC protein, partial [Polyodon spathula]|nr:ANFC protein [Polyodon spathula]
MLELMIYNKLDKTFPEITKLLKIVITTPVITAEAERCFSTLKQIKGRDKTKARLVSWFFWLGLDGNVKRFCEQCGECQKARPRVIPRAPLVPLPLVEAPFERIGMDIVGPLERSAAGYTHLLVILDYATRYPEAIPLRSMSAKSVANKLVNVFSRVGIPMEIQTDQGTNFMSRLMRGTCKLLGIKTIRTSVFHPQNDGLMERFNKTLLLSRLIEKKYSDILTSDDLSEDMSGEHLESESSRVDVKEQKAWAEPPTTNEKAWLRLLRGSLANRKWVSVDKLKKGWARGCFGLKLDRIGSISGLGC